MTDGSGVGWVAHPDIFVEYLVKPSLDRRGAAPGGRSWIVLYIVVAIARWGRKYEVTSACVLGHIRVALEEVFRGCG